MDDDQKLTYRFHDPNPPEETAAVLLRIFLEAHRSRRSETIADPAGRTRGDRIADRNEHRANQC